METNLNFYPKYNSHQTYLFNKSIELQKSGLGYRRISKWFNKNNILTIKGLGPSLEYIKLNYEYLSDKVSPLLEYIHVYKNNKFDSVYYEWYSNRDEINNINYSVLELKNGLYYYNDTLYSGNIFYSNNDIQSNYCCDYCTPLDSLIKKDFIVLSVLKK